MTRQYLRSLSLQVRGLSVAYDLSQLHVEFQINNAIVGTPKWGTVRIWNLGADKATQIIHEFTGVDIAVGWQDIDEQTIISGQIAQVAYGRENAVDTYLDLLVQDADRALLWGVLNKSLPKGYTDEQVLKLILDAWNVGDQPVTLGSKPDLSQPTYPDGFAFSGTAFEAMEQLAHRHDCNWFVEDGQLYIVPRNGVMAGGDAPILTAESGLLGTPVLTYQGIQGRCLMNPQLRVGRTIRLRNSDITQLALRQPVLGITDPGAVVPTINNPIDTYGTYKVLAVTHAGDSRGNQWETRFVCIDVDSSVPNSGPGLVSVPSGGAL